MAPAQSFRVICADCLLGEEEIGAEDACEDDLISVLIVNLEEFNLDVSWSIASVVAPLLRATLNAAATVITLVASSKLRPRVSITLKIYLYS
jgi:hypothetical protein